MHRLNYALIVFLIISLSACSRTAVIQNFHEISYVSPDKASLFQVKQRIYSACLKTGWVPEVSADRLITATYTLRSHVAVVDIAYNFNHYDIIYRDSSNLNYRHPGSNPQGTIHRNYNQWVAKLNTNIHTMLSHPNEADLAGLPDDLLKEEVLPAVEPVIREQQLVTCHDFPDIELSAPATINRSMVNTRTGAGVHCTSTGILKTGARFMLTGKKDAWYQISVDDKTNAWIYAPFIQTIKK